MMSFITRNKLICFLVVAVIGSGVALMTVSQKVYMTERNVKNMNRDALKAEWDIRALKAELAYLSRPDRLDQISSALSKPFPSQPYQFPVATVSLAMPNTENVPTIIPLKKPHYVANKKPTDDFSSLLQTIGGR
jgi:hypothetical protein